VDNLTDAIKPFSDSSFTIYSFPQNVDNFCEEVVGKHGYENLVGILGSYTFVSASEGKDTRAIGELTWS